MPTIQLLDVLLTVKAQTGTVSLRLRHLGYGGRAGTASGTKTASAA